MSASWIIATGDSGTYLSSVTAGSVTVPLEDHPLVTVRMVASGGDTVSATWTSADCSAVASSSLITYTHSEGSTVALALAESGTEDSLLITPTVTLAGAHASGYVLDSIDVQAQLDCSATPWRLRWPELGGEVVPDAAEATTRALMYPSFSTLNEGLHGHAYAYAYEAEDKEGLWIGATDASMRGKSIGRSSDGDNLALRLRMFPEDNRQATSFAFPYAVELAPMAGDWYDADDLYRRRMSAAGLPSMSTALKASEPPAVTGTDVFMYHFTGEPLDTAQIVQDAEDAIALLGVDPARVTFQLYRWHAELIGDTWPDDQFPPRAGAVDLVADLKALGVKVVLYTIQDAVHLTSASYTSEGWSSEIIRTSADAIRYRILGGYSTADNGLHATLDWDDNAVRLERQGSWLVDLRTPFNENFDGIYHDAHGAVWALHNHRSDLPASKRGPGSSAAATAARSQLTGSRSAWRSDQADSVQVTEHANDVTLGACDFTSDQGFSYFAPDVTRRAISVTPNIYSAHQRLINFEAFGSIHDQAIFGDRGWPWLESWRWHDGWLGTVGLQQGVKDAQPPDGDSRSSAWETYMAPCWDFWKRMFVGLASACHRFHTGRRLRPLEAGHEEDLIANGYAYELVTDPESGATSYGITTMARVHSSVWLDTDTGAVGAFFSNWHPREMGTQSVDITTTTHPDLPTGLLRIVSVDPTTGAETVVDHFQRADGWHQTLTLAPREVRHLRIEQAPGTTPTALAAPTAAAASATGSFNVTVSVTGAAASTVTVSGAWSPTGAA